jgi:type I restriction enzyme, S subunit
LLNPKYSFYFFKSPVFRTKIKKITKKSVNQASFNISNLKDIEIPVPSLPDQLHIANLLSKAENLIAQRKESVRLLDEYLKSMFLEMFGDPTNNRKKFPVGKIRDVVTEVKYGTSSSATAEGTFPYLRMNNVTYDGYMDYSNLKYISVSEDEMTKYAVKKGDLLFNRTNSKELVGKTGVYNEDKEMIIAGYLIRVRTNELANPWYLWGYLNSIHGKQTLFGMCKTIVGMANINAQELQGIKIIIPPIELQTKFAKIVEKTEALKSQYQQSLQELENLYGSLSQRAFRGEMVIKKSETKFIALAPETKPVQPELNKQQAFLRKLMLASHIIYELCEEPTFGHTKLMKLLYLSEQAGGMALQTNYKKFAAGPFDGKTLTLIDKEFVKNKWFAIDKRSFTIGGQKREATIYNRTEKSLLYKKHFDNYFESEAETINRIVELFRKEKTQTAEIVATLYFAWKELVTANTIISEDSLVKGFYQFHKEKKKFTEDQILLGYEYMMANELYPHSV